MAAARRKQETLNFQERRDMNRILGELRVLGCGFEVLSHEIETLPNEIGPVSILHVRCRMDNRLTTDLVFNITDYDCW